MIKKLTVLGLLAGALVATTGAFAEDKTAGDKACCTQHVSNATGKGMCADLTVLNLNADQKAKIEAWQAECVKAGCTRDARHKFFQQAKGVLSAEQFAKLKAECKKSKEGGETKTTT